ncbi:hypothetical protein LTR80_011849, partial [Exophiala xenobiotica]
VAVYVEVVAQVFERNGEVAGAETPSSDRHLWTLPPIFQRTTVDLIDAEYTLIRVTLEDRGNADLVKINQDPYETVGIALQGPSITPLNDGSWEILVRNAYLPTLQSKLRDSHIGLTVDSKYCPVEPLREAVEYWGLENARKIYAYWFLRRAIRIIRKTWAIAEMYYRHVLKRYNRRIWSLLSVSGMMSTMGDSMLDDFQTERGDEDVRRQLALIRRRLPKFQTAHSLRHLFWLGDIQA